MVLFRYFVGLHAKVMINRSSWGYSYSIVRGEILGFIEDELLRKHLPRMFSLIKKKLGDRRRLDTFVVLTLNYADSGLAVVFTDSVSTV